MVTLLAPKGYRHLSIGDAIKRYAPPKDRNYPAKYTKFICNKAGLSPLRKIIEIDPFDYLEMIKAMIEFEVWIP